MEEQHMKITPQGLLLLASLPEENKHITFTRLGLGQGAHEETENITDLEDALLSLPLESIEVVGREVQVSFYFTNSELQSSISLREKGLFAKPNINGVLGTEILFAYGVFTEEIIPLPSEVVMARFENMILAIDEEKIDLTVELSPGITKKYFKDHSHNGVNTTQIHYSHIIDPPLALPADGGNADTVNLIALRERNNALEYKKSSADIWSSVSSPIVKCVQAGRVAPKASSLVYHNTVDRDKSIILLVGSVLMPNGSYANPTIHLRTNDSFIIGTTSTNATDSVYWQIIEFY